MTEHDPDMVYFRRLEAGDSSALHEFFQKYRLQLHVVLYRAMECCPDRVLVSMLVGRVARETKSRIREFDADTESFSAWVHQIALEVVRRHVAAAEGGAR